MIIVFVLFFITVAVIISIKRTKYIQSINLYKGEYYKQTIQNFQSEVLKFGSKSQKDINNSKKIVLFLIPGNPGIVQFYDTFLHHLHLHLNQSIDIYALGHANHCLYPGQDIWTTYSLQQQIIHKILLIQNLLLNHPDSKIMFIGHSIGCYMILQIIQQKYIQNRLLQCYMLYPTIERMKQTPRGAILYPILKQPLSFIVSCIACLVNQLPYNLKKKLVSKFINKQKVNEIIIEAILLILNFQISSNCFFLARHELDEVKDLQIDLIKQYNDKLYFYFSTSDEWCPMSYAQNMIKIFKNLQYEIDSHNIKHAFVVESSELQAQICGLWIKKQLSQ